MLRITESFEEEKTVRLRLDGSISPATFAHLEDAYLRHQMGHEQILLDMTGVVFMNNEIAVKIMELKSERLRIINCSAFIEALLNSVERGPSLARKKELT